MKKYNIYIQEPFCSWIEELCEIYNKDNDIKITPDLLIEDLVYTGLISTIDTNYKNNRFES